MADAYPDPAAIIAQTTTPRSPNPPDEEAEPSADQDKDEGTYVEFPMPENFQPPADAKPGKKFQALATLMIDEGDEKTLNLVALDGAPVKPEEEENDNSEKEENEDKENLPGQTPSTMADAAKQHMSNIGMPM